MTITLSPEEWESRLKSKCSDFWPWDFPDLWVDHGRSIGKQNVGQRRCQRSRARLWGGRVCFWMKLINCINFDNFPTSLGTFPLFCQDDISGACPQLRCMMLFLVVGFGRRFWLPDLRSCGAGIVRCVRWVGESRWNLVQITLTNCLNSELYQIPSYILDVPFFLRFDFLQHRHSAFVFGCIHIQLSRFCCFS